MRGLQCCCLSGLQRVNVFRVIFVKTPKNMRDMTTKYASLIIVKWKKIKEMETFVLPKFLLNAPPKKKRQTNKSMATLNDIVCVYVYVYLVGKALKSNCAYFRYVRHNGIKSKFQLTICYQS